MYQTDLENTTSMKFFQKVMLCSIVVHLNDYKYSKNFIEEISTFSNTQFPSVERPLKKLVIFVLNNSMSNRTPNVKFFINSKPP